MTEKSEKEMSLFEFVCLVCEEALEETADSRICNNCFSKGLPFGSKMSQSEVDINQLICRTEEQKIPQEQMEKFIQLPNRNVELAPKRNHPTGKKGNCQACQKKVGISAFSCHHCGSVYCRLHRLPEDHDCEVDFITIGRKKLKMENPQIKSSKIQTI